MSRAYQTINQEYGWDFQNFSTKTLADAAVKRLSKTFKKVEADEEWVAQTGGKKFKIWKVWFK